MEKAAAAFSMGGSRREKLRWLVMRLRAMSAYEILVRGHQTIRKLKWRRRQNWNVPQSDVRTCDDWALPQLNAVAEQERASLLNEADAYIAGRYTLLNTSFEQKKPDWHLDVETATRSPLAFALDIDYRDAKVAGNIKNIWELNRHRHLTVLAVAYALSQDHRYAHEIERQLLSWIACNPFLRGVNWHSALELGVRLIAWVWIERLLRGCSVHERLFGSNGRMWPAIYRHQWLIARLKSVGSSANNHLVGELAGLFIASTVWPHYPESTLWQRRSRTHLEREIKLQTYDSGLNREQAFSYHCFSLELFLLSAIEAERAQTPVSKAYKKTLKQMVEVIPHLADINGNLPSYGDADGGTALQLQPRQSSSIDWLCRLGIGLVQACVPLPLDGSGYLAATLIGPDIQSAGTAYVQPVHSKAFKDAGLYVLTANRGKASEIFCLADAGHLGYLSIAAHGHADALSFTLSVGGHPVIVDPGTYSYFREPRWRRYFRSTRAHNTICIDGQDQSEQGGPFLWVRKANCKVLQWSPTPEGAELAAEHDGYGHLRGTVIHRRRLTLTTGHLNIVDEITGGGNHTLEWFLQFAPDCAIGVEHNRCSIRWNNGGVDIDLSPLLRWRLESGTDSAGWYSPGFNLKVPSTTLIGYWQGALPLAIVNTIHFLR